jgi:phospholipid transport system substrate-binding protein
MDSIIQILRDPQYQSASQKAEQRQKIWLIVNEIFDFKEISQRTLARFWKDFTPEQQQEFVETFSEFLANIYLKRIQAAYKNETVVFIGQDLLSDTKASVKTKVIRDGNIEIPVNYSLLKRDNAWKVYDVAIEGVSLVKNYRTQFRGILLKQEPAQLIETLKQKNEKHKSKTSSAADGCLDLRLMAQRCLMAVWFNRDLAESRIK